MLGGGDVGLSPGGSRGCPGQRRLLIWAPPGWGSGAELGWGRWGRGDSRAAAREGQRHGKAFGTQPRAGSPFPHNRDRYQRRILGSGPGGDLQPFPST